MGGGGLEGRQTLGAGIVNVCVNLYEGSVQDRSIRIARCMFITCINDVQLRGIVIIGGLVI